MKVYRIHYYIFQRPNDTYLVVATSSEMARKKFVQQTSVRPENIIDIEEMQL